MERRQPAGRHPEVQGGGGGGAARRRRPRLRPGVRPPAPRGGLSRPPAANTRVLISVCLLHGNITVRVPRLVAHAECGRSCGLWKDRR